MPKHDQSITRLDIILGALLLMVGSYVFWRLSSELNYNWQWERIPPYFLRRDPASDRWVPNLLLTGFLNTIRLSIWGTLLATILGTLLGLFRISLRLFRRLVGATYVELIRNTPPLVLIFIFYFFISDQIMPLLPLQHVTGQWPPGAQKLLSVILAPPDQLPAFLSALITLALFEGAYVTEIVRAGIQSIERGQWEASAALGMSRRKQLVYIIMPQAWRRILPPLAGQFISTIKDSAIVSVISIPELTFKGMELMATTYLTFEIWITITLLYLLLTFSCSLAVGRLEGFLNRFRDDRY